MDFPLCKINTEVFKLLKLQLEKSKQTVLHTRRTKLLANTFPVLCTLI